MKKCPVCGANVFEDMNTCYNCLHNFQNEEQNMSRSDMKSRIPEISLPHPKGIHGVNMSAPNNVYANKIYSESDFEGLNEDQAHDKFFGDKNIEWSQVENTPLSMGVVSIEPDQALDYLNSYYSFLGSYLQSRQSKNTICNN